MFHYNMDNYVSLKGYQFDGLLYYEYISNAVTMEFWVFQVKLVNYNLRILLMFDPFQWFAKRTPVIFSTLL